MIKFIALAIVLCGCQAPLAPDCQTASCGAQPDAPLAQYQDMGLVECNEDGVCVSH
ncbi:MAG: hypothetical protein ABI832_10440 [bacterium]